VTKKIGGAIIDLHAYRANRVAALEARKPAEPSQEMWDGTFCGVLTKQGKPCRNQATLLDGGIYRPCAIHGGDRGPRHDLKHEGRQRRKNDEPPRWRPMTYDDRNVALTLVSTITTVGPWNDPNESTRAISFMLDMAKKAMIEPDAHVTEKQADWLWCLADKYGLLEEQAS
jgi:hypothetical protein